MNAEKVTYQFPSDLSIIKESFKKIKEFLSDVSLSEGDLYDLKLVFTEAFVNAVKHGNKSDPKLNVDVKVIKNSSHLELIVKDQGGGFDRRRIEDCTKKENLTKNGGRGLFLMHKLMDEVKFENGGTRVRLIKRLKAYA